MNKLIEEMMKRRSLATANANKYDRDIEVLRADIQRLQQAKEEAEAEAAMYETAVEKLKN